MGHWEVQESFRLAQGKRNNLEGPDGFQSYRPLEMFPTRHNG